MFVRHKRIATTAGVLCAVGMLAVGLTSSASASSDNGVPDNFAPTFMSWTSGTNGQVLGVVKSCDVNEQQCDVLLSTANGGQTWTERPLPDVSDHYDYSGLRTFESNGERTWIVDGSGNSHLTYVSHDDGATWRLVDFGLGESSVSEFGQVGAFVYAGVYVEEGGQARIEYVKAPVGTSRWERVPGLGHQVGTTFVPDVELAARGQVGLIEETYYLDDDNPEPYHRLATTDRTGWTVRPDACRNGAGENFPAVGSDGALYMFCANDSFHTPVLKSTDGGETFTEIAQVRRYLSAAAGHGQTLAVGGGVEYNDGCAVQSSVDGGRTWKRTLALDGDDVGNDQLYVFDMRFTDAEHGTLLCQTAELSAGENNDVYRTTDGGRTWEPLGLHTAE